MAMSKSHMILIRGSEQRDEMKGEKVEEGIKGGNSDIMSICDIKRILIPVLLLAAAERIRTHFHMYAQLTSAQHNPL